MMGRATKIQTQGGMGG